MSTEKHTENNEIITRLNEVVSVLGLNNVEPAKKTGYSKAQVGSVLTGKTPLSLKFSKIFCSTFSVNDQWLETGEGEMLKTVVAEQNSSLFPDPSRMTLEQKLMWVGLKTKDIRQIQEWQKLSEEEQDEELRRLSLLNLEKGRY